jgi:hypothetical protein
MSIVCIENLIGDVFGFIRKNSLFLRQNSLFR